MMINQHGSDDDDAITHFIWLLDVPEHRLCEVQDAAIDLAFKIYGDNPLPFFVGVASPEKTLFLRENARPRVYANMVTGIAEVSHSLSSLQGTEGQVPNDTPLFRLSRSAYEPSAGAAGSFRDPFSNNSNAQAVAQP